MQYRICFRAERSEKRHGLSVRQAGGIVTATIVKGQLVEPPLDTAEAVACRTNKTMVISSGDLGRILAAFIMANGAVGMGSKITLFFTFRGLNALRKSPTPKLSKAPVDALLGIIMPCGASKPALSRLHMSGISTLMIKRVMKQKHVGSLSELIARTQRDEVRPVACSMSMEVMGITREEFIVGVEIGGVAAFLAVADDSGTTLFVQPAARAAAER